MPYAKRTTVSVEKSRALIERLLTTAGAKEFASGWRERGAIIQFSLNSRTIRFVLPLPDASEKQETMRRWRSLGLAIKAKLTSIEDKIEEFDEAFMAHIVMPNGMTVAEMAVPTIREAYKLKGMPDVPLLKY